MTSSTFTLRVLLFARLAQELGTRELLIEVPALATAGDALDQLAAQHSAINASRATLAVALNERYVSLDTRLHPSDVLALIPPVSGG